MEEDPFWLVQLTDNAENRMLAEEAPLLDYEVNMHDERYLLMYLRKFFIEV